MNIGLTGGDFTKLVLRRTELSEAEELHKIQYEAFIDDVKLFGTSPSEESLDRMHEKIQHTYYYTILLDHKIIGGASVVKTGESSCRIKRVYFGKAYQNKGFGSEILARLEAEFPEAAEWTLDTPKLHVGNQHFYEKAGYRRIGETKYTDKLVLIDYMKKIESRQNQPGMKQELIIKQLEASEIGTAIDLVWRVFLVFEAPDYSEEGITTFKNSLEDPDFTSELTFYGAFYGDLLLGTIATRNEGKHIALFFVDEKYHRQGIGRKLFECVAQRCTSEAITVNSSPYAEGVYHKLGFENTNVEQVIQGIRFLPMIYRRS